MSREPNVSPDALAGFRARLAAAEDGHDLKGWTDNDDDLSGCPCFSITLPGIHVQGHCWRTSIDGRIGSCACEYVGVHVWGEESDGRRIAELLTAMDWYGEWPLVMEGSADDYRPSSLSAVPGTETEPENERTRDQALDDADAMDAGNFV